MKQNIMREESKIKPKFTVTDSLFGKEEESDDLLSIDTDVVIDKLENNLKFRELSIKKRFDELLKR